MTDFFSRPLQEQLRCMESAAREALPLWNLGHAQLELIKHRENAVYKVLEKGAAPRVMRVHRLYYHSDAELQSELQWMAALAEAGIETPPVVPAADGALLHSVSVDGLTDRFQIDVLEWVDGNPLGDIEEGGAVDEESLVGVYREIGKLAARTHNQVEQWQMPAGFERHAWDLDGLTGEQPFWGRFWELEALTKGQVTLLQKARQKLRAELAEFGTGQDRYGLVHADLLPENLLVDGKHVRLIDFDDAGFGWHLFDLATSLFFHLGEPHFDAILASLVVGYRGERELTDEHLAMLPTFLFARGSTYLGWAHTRKETQTAQDMTPFLVENICALAQEYLND